MPDEHRYADFDRDALLNILSETEKLSNVGGWEWDIVKDLWTFSDNWLRIHGFSKRNLTTSELLSIAHPDDRQDIQNAFNSAVTEGTNYEIEHRIIRQDTGEERYIRSFGKPKLDSEGKAVKLYGSAQEITEQKMAEETLRQSNEMYKRTEAIANVGSWEWEIETDTVTWSEELYRIFQLDPDGDAPNWAEHSKLLHPEDSEKLRQAAEKAIADGKPYEIKLRAIRKDGKIRICKSKGFAQIGTDRKVTRLFGLLQDITDKKIAEKKLKKSEEQYRLIAENMADIITTLDMELNFTYVSPSIINLRGFTVEEAMKQKIDQIMTSESFERLSKAYAEEISLEQTGAADSKGVRIVELEEYKKDGSTIWIENTVSFIRDSSQNPIGILSISRDITERKKTEKALNLKHTMLARTEAVAHVGSWEWKADGDKVTWSEELFRIFGLEPMEEAPSFKEHQAFYVPEDRVRLVKAVEECLRNSVPYDLEVRITRKDGQLRHCVVRGIPEHGDNGAVNRLYGSMHDITERKKAEETLNKSHEMLKFTEAMANIGSWEWDVQHDRTFWSEELFRIFGRDPSDGAPPFAEQSEFYADGDMQRLRDAVESCIKRGTRYEIELQAIRTDGEIRHCVSRGKAQYDENGKVFRLIGSFQDITKRKLSEDALRESENQISSIFRSAPIGIGSVVNRVLSKVNNRLCEMTGYDETELIGQSSRLLYASDEDFEYVGREKYAQIADHGTGTVETRWQKKDGAIIDVLLSSTPVDLQDQSKAVTFTALNITEPKQAEMALKESEERFRTLMENIDAVAVQGYGPDGTTQYWNKASERLYGYSRQEAIGRTLLDLIIPSEMKGAVVEEMQEMAKSGQPIPSGELLLMHKDGSRVPVISHHAIVRVPGREQELFCLDVDITERKQAEEERENLRKQLNQAQKMESVGRLAGGVAHDYNNMLGVILGRTELALLQADESHDLHSDLKEIQTAAQRSADITKQLLAFARKQTISPKQLDLNNTVESMLNMLRRLIGENIDLLWKPSAHLWPVKMDPSQIDQILANLCVNAKDAIAGVGKLTIETGKQTFDEEYCNEHPGFIPGDFVMLAVSDNGCGMDKDTLDNLFEPFFTTKEAGKGTGLGLATVYGIVKQNKGFINVYSEPGQGSTFKIYLSRFFVDEGTDNKSTPEKNEAAGGTETILLVEDEPSILQMTRIMLERKGYSVLSAATPAEAINTANAHIGKIHLLMTDVVMPEMNGRDLAEKISETYPDIKLLFMSGYTANVIAHQGVLDDGVAFIQKPFSMADMTAKVREILDKTSNETQQ